MQEIVKTMMIRPITTVGKYIMLMGRTFARPERMHMFFKQYLNEMVQLGVNSIGIVPVSYTHLTLPTSDLV